VDLNARRVRVERSFYRGSFAAPKSRYSRRSIPLSRDIARELELRWLLEDDPEALLFASEAGGVLDSSNLMSRILKPAARRAGVPWAGFHTLRHTCATLLFRRGVNPKQIQVWLGHHSPAFTLAVYTHLLPDDLPADVSILDDLPEAGGDHETTMPAVRSGEIDLAATRSEAA
jgi:integrase